MKRGIEKKLYIFRQSGNQSMYYKSGNRSIDPLTTDYTGIVLD